MKQKILATLQKINVENDNYLDYVGFLAKDFSLALDVVATSPRVMMANTAQAVVGSGIMPPTQIVENKVFAFNHDLLISKIEDLKARISYLDVDYDIDIGPIENRISDDILKERGLFWTMNRVSGDTLINELWGTTETEFSKSSALPCLNIPEGYNYKRPENILVIIRDLDNINLASLKKMVKTMGLKVTYAFHEEEHIGMQKIMNALGTPFNDFIGTVKTISLDYSGGDLDKMIDYLKPEWLAFMNYDRSFYERMYKVSTNHIVLKSDLPTLII